MNMVKENTKELLDNRMGCLRYIDELDQNQSNEVSFYAEEYEYFSDSRICGIFSIGEKRQITFRMIETDKNEYGYYRYLLHIPTIINTDMQPLPYQDMIKSARDDGYYFKGGIHGELISTFSVLLRARFYLRSRTFRDKEQISSKTTYPIFLPDTVREYSAIFNDEKKNLTSDLIPFFKKIQELRSENHFNIMHSFKEYHEALKSIGVDHDIVYLKLVVALEGIAVTEKNRSHFKDDFSECYEILKEDKIRLDEIVKLWATRGSFRSIRDFLERYLLSTHSDFAKTEYLAAPGDIKEISLKDTMNRIYHARSKYVHEGISMNISRVGWEESPYEPVLGGVIDKRKFNPEDMLPMVSYFEKMVSDTLVGYVNLNTTD